MCIVSLFVVEASDVVLETQVLVSRRLETKTWSRDVSRLSFDVLVSVLVLRHKVLFSVLSSWAVQVLVLGLEVRKHIQNYDCSEKGSFSLKNLILRVFGGTLAVLQYFLYYL